MDNIGAAFEGSYEEEVDYEVMRAFLGKNGLWDDSKGVPAMMERYRKFSGVTFGVAPKEKWPEMY